jgi:hypothetical protein
MKRALWLLLLIPGLCVFALADERGTCDSSWHCVAPASALADGPPAEADEALAEKTTPNAGQHLASALLDATVPPGDK